MAYITIANAAHLAGVSEQTIRRRVEAGEIGRAKRGNKVVVLESDIRKIWALPAPSAAPTGPCRVIAVANQKGGVGKTSTAANLAAALAAHRKVLAIDCDSQGNLTMALGPDPDTISPTLYDVLVHNTPIEAAVISPVLNLASLHLVGANLDLAAVDTELPGISREARLRSALATQLPIFDFVVIDCPPALGLMTLNALVAATEVITPVNPSSFSLRGTDKLLSTIDVVRAANPQLGRVRALANLVDATNLAKDMLTEVSAVFGDDLFETRIRRSVRIGEAQAAQSPLTVFRPSDPSADDYRALAEEILHG